MNANKSFVLVLFGSWTLTNLVYVILGKDELRQCFPSNFLGCISFLCQVFGQMKVLKADGTIEPFLPLIVPVYEALEMLLDNNCTDAEMECAVIQVQLNYLKCSFTISKLNQTIKY